MANHVPAVSDVIMGRARYIGIDTALELSRKTGIPIATIYRRLHADSWTLHELQQINKKIQFTVSDAEALLGHLTREGGTQ